MSTNIVKDSQKELSPSTRFMNLVVREFESNSGDVQLTDHMKRLVQSNFIKLDSILKDNETKRLQKTGQYQDALEFAWKNVNMEKMAQDVVAWAMVGLDPMQPNQVFLIPYKNGHTNKFDIGFMPGYKGIEIKARKFGLDVPSDVVIELVHEKDVFTVKKKDFNNPVEHYTLDVSNPFDRGNVIGGFYYFRNEDETRNFIKVFSVTDILKRKPKYASPEFWGGEKDDYKDGKKTGKKTAVDGWYEEMCFKTIYRAAYNSITIDSEKINDHFVKALQSESETIERNTVDIDHSVVEIKEVKTPFVLEEKTIEVVEQPEEKQPIEIKSTTEKMASKQAISFPTE